MSETMMSMMMAHMNAAAVAAAAMGLAAPALDSGSVIAQNQTLAHQPLYSASQIGYPQNLIGSNDDGQLQKLFELQSTQQLHHQQAQSRGYSNVSYNDYQPSALFGTSVGHSHNSHTNNQSMTKDGNKRERDQSRDALESENEDDHSESANGDEDSGGMPGKTVKSELKNSNLTIADGKLGKKICRVCGDKALGYNFNVVSCESCKAFFRRNALKNKEFRCPFNDSCEVTVVSRRFCQKCRLRKCFDVGMKKEWIMSDEARLQKRSRIEENRRKRTSTPDFDQPQSIENNLSTEQDQPTSPENPPPEKKPNISKPEPVQPNHDRPNHVTNIDFSPHCQTPPMYGLGGPFSPPPSTTSKTSISPIVPARKGPEMHHKVAHTKQYQPAQSTELETNGKVAAENGKLAKNPINVQQFSGLDFGLNGSINSYSADLNDSITIPKNVLISLINQCHSTPTVHDLFHKPPPIVARAQRLVVDGCQLGDDMAQCICRCACGARSANGRIGVRTVDKCVGSDVNEDREKIISIPRLPVPSVGSPSMDRKSTPVIPTDWDSELGIIDTKKFTKHVGQLTDFENWKLKELYMANRVMADPLDKYEENNWKQMEQLGEPSNVVESNGDQGGGAKLTNTIHLTDICVRRIIKMCKRISAFGSLCQEDQIALLKGGCTELMLLRGVMTFIPEKESWRPVGCKDTLLSLDVLKGVKGNVYEEHRKFLHSFHEEWRRSDAIMLTLAAITLFNPLRPNLAHVQAVQMEQDSYSELLKHYLDIMYGTDTVASSEAFNELLVRVESVKRLNDYAATIFLEVNPTDVEPLLIEIFDLK